MNHNRREFIKRTGFAAAAVVVPAILQMGVTCIQLGRKLKWGPKKEAFIGDDEANKLSKRPEARKWEDL
jgi:hypothetical protein